MIDKHTALLVFIAAYVGFVFFHRLSAHFACLAALLLVFLGVIGPGDALQAINWNVMGIFVGTLVVAELFMLSRMPAYLAEILVNRAGNLCVAMLLICGLTGLLSAFMANVATVLIMAPIAMALSARLEMAPSLFLISLAICSNLQGTATLIGDPPSMILAGYTGMTFDDFFFYRGRPSIFFAVEIGALASFVVLYLFFRRYHQPAQVVEVERVKSWAPTWLLLLLIISLASSTSFNHGFKYMAGGICMLFGLIGLVWYKLSFGEGLKDFVKGLDWHTTLFLMGVFVIVGGLTTVGLIDDLSHLIHRLSGDNLLVAFLLMVWLSVLFSAFVDNIPYLIAMIPVAQHLSTEAGSRPELLLFGLLIGTCLGGNVTPIGASANVVTLGLLRRNGTHVSFMEFVKIGLPFTLAAVAAASAFLWLVWA